MTVFTYSTYKRSIKGKILNFINVSTTKCMFSGLAGDFTIACMFYPNATIPAIRLLNSPQAVCFPQQYGAVQTLCSGGKNKHFLF